MKKIVAYAGLLCMLSVNALAMFCGNDPVNNVDPLGLTDQNAVRANFSYGAAGGSKVTIDATFRSASTESIPYLGFVRSEVVTPAPPRPLPELRADRRNDPVPNRDQLIDSSRVALQQFRATTFGHASAWETQMVIESLPPETKERVEKTLFLLSMAVAPEELAGERLLMRVFLPKPKSLLRGVEETVVAAESMPLRIGAADAQTVHRVMAAKPRPSFYASPNGEVMPATAYRYMDSKYAQTTMNTMEAPLSYFGFEKFNTGAAARDAFQMAPSWSDARLRGTFDTLQLFDKNGQPLVRVPLEAGGKGLLPEPFTCYYPQYGAGGTFQLVPTTPGMKVQFSEVRLVP